MWYWVPAPIRAQAWLALFSPATAPLTGVPTVPLPAVDASRVSKVSGWPSLSVRCRFSHQLKSPARLPTEALAAQARQAHPSPAPDVVEQRDLAVYDTAFGLTDGQVA